MNQVLSCKFFKLSRRLGWSQIEFNNYEKNFKHGIESEIWNTGVTCRIKRETSSILYPTTHFNFQSTIFLLRSTSSNFSTKKQKIQSQMRHIIKLSVYMHGYWSYRMYYAIVNRFGHLVILYSQSQKLPWARQAESSNEQIPFLIRNILSICLIIWIMICVNCITRDFLCFLGKSL